MCNKSNDHAMILYLLTIYMVLISKTHFHSFCVQQILAGLAGSELPLSPLKPDGIEGWPEAVGWWQGSGGTSAWGHWPWSCKTRLWGSVAPRGDALYCEYLECRWHCLVTSWASVVKG